VLIGYVIKHKLPPAFTFATLALGLSPFCSARHQDCSVRIMHMQLSISCWVLPEKPTDPQLVRKFPAFYVTQSSLPHSKGPATCTYPEPDRFSPWPPPLQFSKIFLYRRTCPVTRLLWLFRNMIKFLRWGVVSISPNPQAGRPPLIGCPRLLIQYILSYPPYLEAVPPSATWGLAMPWWQGPTYHGRFY
jgi:hypothetical protein